MAAREARLSIRSQRAKEAFVRVTGPDLYYRPRRLHMGFASAEAIHPHAQFGAGLV